MNPREMTMAAMTKRVNDGIQATVDARLAELEQMHGMLLSSSTTALDDIRDACGREGAAMTPSEVSQLAVERIATLEADLAASREREAALAAENARCREIAERDGKDYSDAIAALRETREALESVTWKAERQFAGEESRGMRWVAIQLGAGDVLAMRAVLARHAALAGETFDAKTGLAGNAAALKDEEVGYR